MLGTLLLLIACTSEPEVDFSYDGAWTGSFVVDVAEASSGSPADQCMGEATLEMVSDQLSGTATCSFSGELAEALPGEHQAVITGDLVEDTELLGDVELDVAGNIIVDDWSGSFSADEHMQSEVEGSFELNDLTWNYLGGFDVVREE